MPVPGAPGERAGSRSGYGGRHTQCAVRPMLRAATGEGCAAGSHPGAASRTRAEPPGRHGPRGRGASWQLPRVRQPCHCWRRTSQSWPARHL
eukprot:4286903-Alexandrium_andersonii.AAC.1